MELALSLIRPWTAPFQTASGIASLIDESEPVWALIGSVGADGFMMSLWWVITISNRPYCWSNFPQRILFSHSLTLPCIGEGKEGGGWVTDRKSATNIWQLCCDICISNSPEHTDHIFHKHSFNFSAPYDTYLQVNQGHSNFSLPSKTEFFLFYAFIR